MFKSLITNYFLKSKIPDDLRERFISINKNDLDELKKSFLINHFTKNRGYNGNYLKSTHGTKAMDDALVNRLNTARHLLIPWIANKINLHDSKILEIGCGSGSGTVALAEQAKFVIGLDIDLDIINVAKDRCRIHGINNVEFHNSDILDFEQEEPSNVNVVVFFASLEHMLWNDRKSALKKAWELLPNDGYLIIIDTPNRLFYYDGHTTDLPFYNWLPDNISFEYIKNKPDHLVNYLDSNISKPELLIKGRGISFHDLEISLSKSIDEIEVIDSLNEYERREKKLFNVLKTFYRILRLRNKSIELSYTQLMTKYQPHLHTGFFQQYINMIFQKN